MNPQEQFFQNNTQNPQPSTPNIMDAVSNASPEQLDIQTTTKGDVQMNVVNAVNANGIVSGRKVVDFIWQRVAICAMIIATGCAIAVIVIIMIANNLNINGVKQEADKDAAINKLNDLYAALNVSDQQNALAAINNDEILSGTDILNIHQLIISKYGENAIFDATASAENIIKVNDRYKVISLKIKSSENTFRVFMYAKYNDNEWKIAAYDSGNEKNPCKDVTEEELLVLDGLIKCPEEVSDESNEEGSGEDESGQLENGSSEEKSSSEDSTENGAE